MIIETSFLNLLSSCSYSTNKDIKLVPDPNGLIDLPKGFSYKIISETGQLMTDGFFVPERPDGMAIFEAPKPLCT